jgi:hypothetical protein
VERRGEDLDPVALDDAKRLQQVLLRQVRQRARRARRLNGEALDQLGKREAAERRGAGCGQKPAPRQGQIR